MATIYGFTPGDSGSAPFAVHNGGDVMHVYTAEGAPLGAAWLLPGIDPERVARGWAEEHGLEVVDIRPQARNYLPADRCFNCGRWFPERDEGDDGSYLDKLVSLFKRVYTSKRWGGVIRTDWMRCNECHAKEMARTGEQETGS